MESGKIDYSKAVTYDELNSINKELTGIYDMMQKQLKIEEKPSGIADRVFIDLFGTIALYLLLFFACDITRSIVLDQELFGLKWIFFGPYYFFTSAPLLTRLWKPKKFLEDLSEIKSAGFEYDPSRSCSALGETYKLNCEIEENHPHKHPIRDNLGKGLDWIIRHTIGQHLGGVLGNGNCDDQSATIARDCANDRLQRAYNAYTFFCEQHGPVAHVADMNMPNAPGDISQQTRGWDTRSVQAYQAYYSVYTALFDIGTTVVGQNGEPDNLNPRYDSTNNYCFNANRLFSIPITSTSGFGQPPWWEAENGQQQGPCYYQDNYTEHLLTYWDPV